MPRQFEDFLREATQKLEAGNHPKSPLDLRLEANLFQGDFNGKTFLDVETLPSGYPGKTRAMQNFLKGLD